MYGKSLSDGGLTFGTIAATAFASKVLLKCQLLNLSVFEFVKSLHSNLYFATFHPLGSGDTRKSNTTSVAQRRFRGRDRGKAEVWMDGVLRTQRFKSWHLRSALEALSDIEMMRWLFLGGRVPPQAYHPSDNIQSDLVICRTWLNTIGAFCTNKT